MPEKIRVLYVDDEPNLLDIGKQFLEQSGDFTVTTATSAPDAIRLLEQESFDTIVSDYQMPEMDGIEFLVLVRAKFGQIPFILFTGKGREEVVIQAINSGADFYLQKGGDPGAQFAELSHKIKQAAARKRADDALKRSEEKYRHLIEHTDEAILVAQDGMLRLVNHRMVELSGYSEEELLSTPFPVFIHPDDRDMVVERYKKRLKDEEVPPRYAFRLNPKDGNTRWVEISAVAIDWDGRPATLNFLTDITERKQADDSLREEQQFSKLILDSLPGIFYLYTYPEDRLIRWNKQHETLLGYTAEEIKGKLSTDLHLPEYKDAVLKAIDEVMEKGQSSVESTLLAKDGRLIPFFFTGVRFEAPGQLYFMGIGIDITERKRAEQKLVAAKERLEEAHHLAHIGTWDWVMENDTVTWSEELYNIAGRDPSLPAPTYAEHPHFYTPASWDSLNCAVTKALTTGEPYNLELELVRQDGSIRWTNAFGGVIRDGNEKVIGLHGTVQDITERKRQEEVLQRSEEKFRAIADYTVNWESWFGPDGKYIWVSPSVTGFTGYSVEEILAMPDFISNVIAKEDRPLFTERFREAIRGIRGEYFEFRYLHRNGTKHWLNVSWQPIFDMNGNSLGTRASGQDITQRKRAEEELITSQSLLNITLDSIPDIIGIQNTDHTIVRYNRAWYEFLHLTPEEVHGRKCYELIGRTIPCEKCATEKALKTKRMEQIENYLPDYDIHLDCRSSPVLDKDGEIVFIVEQLRNITERKRAEVEISESEQRFRAIYDQSPIAIELFDDTGVLKHVNPACLKLFGVESMQVLGGFSLFTDPNIDDEYKEKLHQREPIHYQGPFDFEKVKTLDLYLTSRDGIIWLDVLITPLGNSAEPITGFLVQIQDITARKKAEETIRLALAEKEVLLREIHHRVKNNLAGILALIELQISSLSDPA
ncbi:MAG: PAS domain S-box protein, partial [Methanoregula sp.]|nr:PAS domain S-box protein [Methanoregula sp.]